MSKNKINTEALKGFIEHLVYSRPQEITAAPRPGRKLPTIKGFCHVSVDALKAALLLPHRYDDGGKWKKYKVSDCVELLKEKSPFNFSKVIDITTRETLYRKDTCLARLKVSYDEACVLLGLGEDNDDIDEYAAYLEKKAKNKDVLPGWELYLKQQATLIEVLKKETKLAPKLLANYIAVHTTFADNRVFHPLTNWKKTERRKIFTFESDIVASQVSLLARIVKVNYGHSEFTDLVDECRSDRKRDIYLELAQRSGMNFQTRGDAKTMVLKSLFNGSDNWVWKDEGIKKTMALFRKGKDYQEYETEEWPKFYDAHRPFMSMTEMRRKFDKLYLRKYMTGMELMIMTQAARLLTRTGEKFITVHDCFAFQGQPSIEATQALDTFVEEFGVEFKHARVG